MPLPGPDEATDLPDLTAILVVDAEGFSRHNDLQQDQLAVLIQEVLEDACHRSGLEELWEKRKFPDSTGDGFIIGFAPRFLPYVIDRYFDALQEVLAGKAARLRSQGMRLRLRLSLHLGPARELQETDSPVGGAMISTHRIIDAAALRALLRNSDPDVTLLAVALSERVMADVVTAGHTRRRTASQFVECQLTIAAKDFTATAFLHVPLPSGALLQHGLTGAVPAESVEMPATPRKASRGGRNAIKVRGDGNVTAGRDVDQSRHETTVHGDSYSAGRSMSLRRDSQ